MEYSAMAAKGYATTSRETASDKQMELKVFNSITARMAAADPSRPGGFAELAEAMHENVRLWNIIAVDMIDASNQLSQDLRAQILELSEFTRLHTLKVLNGSADPQALIDINKAMIGGLSGILPEQDMIEAA